MENLQLNVSNETKEITIREAAALPVAHPKGIKITGTLAAPFQFFEGKRPEAIQSHIQIKKDTGVISLYLLDTDPYSESVIIGQLKRDSVLEQWRINSEKRWTVSEFLKHIKTMRYYFGDRAECNALVESLQKWNAKVETVIAQHNDNAGNSLSMLEKKVSDIQLKTHFSLLMPIFQGYSKVKFTVEIGLDPKNTSVDLYLISDELIELEIQQREMLIESELEKFKDFPCSKVVIS